MDPLKLQMLEELLSDAQGGVGADLKSKYSPPEAPDKPKTEVVGSDGGVVEKIGVNGMGGSSDVGDPGQLLADLIAKNPALRKLLGLEDAESELNGGI